MRILKILHDLPVLGSQIQTRVEQTMLRLGTTLLQLTILVSVSRVAVTTESSPQAAVCEGCELISTTADATCTDFDPVTCKETGDYLSAFPQFFGLDGCGSKDTYELCSVSQSGNASEPSCVLDQVPDDMQLKLHYDGKSPSYGIELTWPSLQLPSECIEGYYVLDYYGNIADASLSCEVLENQLPECAVSTNDTTIAYARDLYLPDVRYITVKVVAYPVYVWSVTFRVGTGSENCVARCSDCSCPYPSAPTNLTWMPDGNETGTGRLSWESEEDPSSISYHYLHLNSSTGEKLLYRIDGTKSSVMLHNLVGNESVWMESYGFECGCSSSSDAVSLPITESPTTPLFSASSTYPSSSQLPTVPSYPASSTYPSSSQLPTAPSSPASLPAVPSSPASSTYPSSSPLPTVSSSPASSTSPGTTSEATTDPMGSTNKLLVIALPVGLAMVFLLVVLLVVSGIIVVHCHRHNAHTLKFLSKVEICRTFSRNDEKKKNNILHVESCYYQNGSSPCKSSSVSNYTYAVTVRDADEDINTKTGCRFGTGSPCKLSSESSSHPYVLLVFSQETPPGDQDVIRAYAQQLNKKVRVKMYDASDRLTRTAWLEDHYRSAVAVLCVCNSAFAGEWRNLSTPSGGSIVSAVRMMVQGKIERQKRLEKFAVLQLHQEDADCTPTYLENVKSFLLSPQQIDSIAHFALSVKEFDYQ